MKRVMCVGMILAGISVLVAGTTTISQNQNTGNRLIWDTRLSEARGPIRTADTRTPLGKTVSSEILGGPANGSDAAYLIYTRMPPGARGPALFTLPTDHLYLVLSGKMTIQIGTEKFVAGPDTGVMVPAGVPHETWNAEAEPEAHVEVIAPAPSRDLMSMLRPAQPRAIENASQFVRPAPPLPAQLRPGLNQQRLFARNTGSVNVMRIDSSPAGSGMPNTHIHNFQQVYFVKEGTMTLFYGVTPQGLVARYQVPPNSFVVIPPGVVHANFNDGATVERHIVWLLPEPEAGQPLDITVDVRPPAARRGARGPQ
jgi:mannose-6-phosphate isomerase-like protein (cupin superfamily)